MLSRLLAFAAKNTKLLYPEQGAVPPLSDALEKPRVAASAQGLELSGELRDRIREFSTREGREAVSMLNFLAFKPGMKGSYLEYGKAFAEPIGSRRGGCCEDRWDGGGC